MTKKLFRFYLFLPFIFTSAAAQNNNYGVKGFYPQTAELTDSVPVVLNGLKAGYIIKETDLESRKENQGRYKIYFYISNTSTEAKIMYQNAGFLGHAGEINNNIATFNCKNATGARFTNKQATMQLQPCYLLAAVEDVDCASGKKSINRRSVNVGYWLRPGETVSKTYLMYTPQNEKPKINITVNGEVANQTGSLVNINSPETNSLQQVPASSSFVKIKNYAHNTYLNNQQGPVVCTDAEPGWWSAEWEILPAQTNNSFVIRNRWTNNYLNIASNGFLSADAGLPTSIWTIQETSQAGTYYIKSMAGNARLYVEYGVLKMSNNFISNDNLCKWIIGQ